MDFKNNIRTVADFPKEGISFKDITTLLIDGPVFKQAIDACVDAVKDIEYTKIVGPEARGFVVGAPMSYATGKGFIPIRKPGKLPAEVLSYEYDLEYGTDTLEVHKDAIQKGDKIIIADDLLATGGTVEAVAKMIEQLGGEVVAMVFLIELEFLNGREKLKNYNIKSLTKY